VSAGFEEAKKDRVHLDTATGTQIPVALRHDPVRRGQCPDGPKPDVKRIAREDVPGTVRLDAQWVV